MTARRGRIKSAAQARRHDDAAAAWMKARAGGPEALLWLMRAARLAPEDPRIALELAQAQAASGGGKIQAAAGGGKVQAASGGKVQATASEAREAAAGFARLAARYDLATAWMGAALANAQCGDMAAAARALAVLLRRHCVSDDADFMRFAGHVAAAAGYGGFTFIRADGSLCREGRGRRLGAGPDHAALNRIEGLVAWEKDGISGWAARPAAPDTPPALWLRDAKGETRMVTFGAPLPADDTAPFLPRYRFRLGPARLRGLTPPFSFAGADERQIFGSPLDPTALAQPPIPAARRGRAPEGIPRRAPLALLMPVYRGLEETRAALRSVLAAAPKGARVIVVDDCTPEPALARHLDRLAAQGRIHLRRHTRNLGFCAAVNTGLAAAKGRDVLLLNADILLPPGAIETLRDVAYAAAAHGTVTALSNEASICSYPEAKGGNAMPKPRQAARLNRLARAANGLAAVEIPTAVGFCMYIRHDCLRATGGFRAEIFAQGYGEENDFSLRARQLGYRHVAAAGAYVAHHGGVSFRAAARGLMARNLAILNTLFPGYQALVAAHQAADPLAPYRARLDEQRLLDEAAGRDAVLLISHGHGGGVARQVAADLRDWRARGFFPLLLGTRFPAMPEKTPYPWPAQLTTGADETPGNLVFPLPAARAPLLALLRRLRVRRVVLHHSLGHDPSVRGLAAALGVPQELVLHDYASLCPRVNLLNRPHEEAPLRYCGEPAEAECIACCRRRDGGVHDRTPVPQLRARSAAEFAAAARVVVPSADMARRLRRYFPQLHPEVRPWEDDNALPPPRPPAPQRPGGRRRIAVIGGIGPAKGFDLLIECARDATARGLPLEFIVIGGSADDAALIAAGIYVTGPYREGEAGALIARLAPDIAFLPSIWPETWCFALGEAWAAGLPALVFNLGAQGERMAAVGRGVAVPLGLPAQRINDMLTALAAR